MKKFLIFIYMLFMTLFFFINVKAKTILYLWEGTTIEVMVFTPLENYLSIPKCSVIEDGYIKNVNINYSFNNTYYTLSTVNTSKVGKYYLDFVAEIPSYSHTSEQRVTFNVVDKTAPTIKFSDIEVDIFSEIDFKDYINIEDNYYKTNEISVTIDSSSFKKDKIGEYQIKITAIDPSNNKTIEYMNVSVVDTDLPSIIKKVEEITISYGSDTFYAGDYYEAFDDYDTDLTHKIVLLTPIDFFQIGEQRIELSVTDSSNNTFKLNDSIFIVDSTKPTITLTTNYIELNSYSEIDIAYLYSLISSVEDNFSELLVDDVDIDISEVEDKKGEYYIYYTLSDQFENTQIVKLRIKLLYLVLIEVVITPIIIEVGSAFDYLDYITILKEEGVEYYISLVNHNVDVNTAGNYKIDVMIFDSLNNRVSKTIDVTVLNKQTPNSIKKSSSIERSDIYFIIGILGAVAYFFYKYKISNKKNKPDDEFL